VGLVYKEDEDLHFLQHCSEEQLKVITALLTHDDNAEISVDAFNHSASGGVYRQTRTEEIG
jgi:hypothetical protein